MEQQTDDVSHDPLRQVIARHLEQSGLRRAALVRCLEDMGMAKGTIDNALSRFPQHETTAVNRRLIATALNRLRREKGLPLLTREVLGLLLQAPQPVTKTAAVQGEVAA